MNSFAFKRNMEFGGSIHATLGETISLVDNHMVIKYQTDYEAAPGTEQDFMDDKKKLRKITHDFSDDSNLNLDSQVVVDENNINYHLMNMFHQTGTYSLTEYLVSVWPEKFNGGALFIKGLMSVAVWGTFFPNLSKKYTPTTQVDLRCSFGKQFLKDGGLTEDDISKVRFIDENKVEGDLHFGCKVFAFDKGSQEFDMSAMMELLQTTKIDKDDERWKSTQSFYMSTKFAMEFEFGDDASAAFNPVDILAGITGNKDIKNIKDKFKANMPYIFAKVVDFTPEVRELTIMDSKGKLDKSEGKRLNDFIKNIK